MNRENFRLLLYGHYVFINLQETGTIEREPMQKYVDGGMFAYDFLKKQEVNDKLYTTLGSDNHLVINCSEVNQ